MHRFQRIKSTCTECNPDFLSLIDSIARESSSPNTAILELLLMTLQTPNLRTMGRAITSSISLPPASNYSSLADTSQLSGLIILFCYPRTGAPGELVSD
jgi:hypothetical protein